MLKNNWTAKQQLSEYAMEVDYYEKKYGKKFQEFDSVFRSQKASFEIENDWMNWNFALETHAYWENILKCNCLDTLDLLRSRSVEQDVLEILDEA